MEYRYRANNPLLSANRLRRLAALRGAAYKVLPRPELLQKRRRIFIESAIRSSVMPTFTRPYFWFYFYLEPMAD